MDEHDASMIDKQMQNEIDEEMGYCHRFEKPVKEAIKECEYSKCPGVFCHNYDPDYY